MKGQIEVRRLNIRGRQAAEMAADPDGQTAREFKHFALKEARQERYVLELYLVTAESKGIGHSDPWFVAMPEADA
jgi:hypothetical protein